MTIKDLVADLLREALKEAQNRGLLPPVSLPDPEVEQAQNAAHGDYASSLPLKLARAARMSPLALGEALVPLVPPREEFARVEFAPPGFINFSLAPSWLRRQVDSIIAQGSRFGEIDIGKGERVQVEFVSVNPTGPIHVGHGRGAVLGSSLANVLSAAGYAVHREYYVNDGGNQMDAFFRSLWARYRQALGVPAEVPEEGYHGEYMRELADEFVQREGDRYLLMPEKEAIAALGQAGMRRMIEEIKRDLERVHVSFDEWFNETSLYQNGTYENAMALLKAQGFTTEKDDALWFASSTLGEDKDSVLVRRTGVPTYFASDIAYHYNKFHIRSFDRVINVWGADHMGHVPRMKAAVKAFGIDPERLHIIIVQLVTLRRGGEVVRLSKRTGDVITLQELIDEVGPDACRYFFLSRTADAQMDFDLELAKKESPENPVFYIQYAHARIASIFRTAREHGIEPGDGDPSLLTEEVEERLIRTMLQLPEVIETAARTLSPHHLPYYVLELATLFHDFYTRCRVISDDQALTAARMKLVRAVQIVLAKGLYLMGMTVPERM